MKSIAKVVFVVAVDGVVVVVVVVEDERGSAWTSQG